MSTSLLFHAFGIQGYQLQKTEYTKEGIYFHITQDKHNLRCPICKSPRVIRRGTLIRTFRSVPIGNRRTYIVLPVQRVFCEECKFINYVNIQFAERRKRYTRAFKRYALSLLRHATVKDVATLLGVGWDLIKAIDKSDLKKHQSPALSELRRIAIDEIYFGGKFKYLTIVLDIVSGEVVFVGEGKSAESVAPFWKRIRKSGANIEAVATDLSGAYIKAIKDNLPNAVHVADPFHIVKLFNDRLSDFRRELLDTVDDTEKKTS